MEDVLHVLPLTCNVESRWIVYCLCGVQVHSAAQPSLPADVSCVLLAATVPLSRPFLLTCFLLAATRPLPALAKLYAKAEIFTPSDWPALAAGASVNGFR